MFSLFIYRYSVETDMTASSQGNKSCPTVVEYELPLDYENHKTKADSNSAKSSSVIEDIHQSYT